MKGLQKRMRAPLRLVAATALLAGSAAMAQDAPRRNAFDDPFGPATAALANCPPPQGPLLTEAQARAETHWRAERGTSCFRSGRCRLPNAYAYDKEIFPRAVRFIQQDPRFAGTSLWLTVQRRWITVEGCVASAQQARDLEAALRLIDDVEAVIPLLMVGVQGAPPYPVADKP
jgi:hypothetical protein